MIRRFIERAVRMVGHTCGLDITWARSVDCAYLAKPKAAHYRQARATFADAFPLAPSAGLSLEEAHRRAAAYEWFFPLELGGKLLGGDSRMARTRRARHARRYQHVFANLLQAVGGSLEGQRVLDIGCNAGYWSIQARRAGASEVLGIDASAQNIAQARFLAQAIGLEGVRYEQRNVYDLTPEGTGQFDLTFFVGVLYHLDRPVEALERICAVTRHALLIDTKLFRMQTPVLQLFDDDVSYYHQPSHSNTLAMIPSQSAVVMMLKRAGFKRVLRAKNYTRRLPPGYRDDGWGTFIAFKA